MNEFLSEISVSRMCFIISHLSGTTHLQHPDISGKEGQGNIQAKQNMFVVVHLYTLYTKQCL